METGDQGIVKDSLNNLFTRSVTLYCAQQTITIALVSLTKVWEEGNC